jgi:squalene-associated FAD-dependent desaturase
VSGTVHVIGAGLAGLAAALRLADSGERVVLHEAAKAAGGRCRSYRDATLGLDIDNGNHLLLSGNEAARAFLDRVGGMDAMSIAAEAAFDFADLRTNERWRLRPNAGRLPWWILFPSRRVPGTRLAEYLAPLAILRAPPNAAIGSVMACEGTLWDRLWNPVLVAALNTEPAEATAGLAARILRETLGAGGNACRPMIATGGLSAAFVTPALDALEARGAEIRLGTRLRALTTADGRVTKALFADGEMSLGPEDRMVLAVPAWVAAELLPDLVVPTEHRAIVNAHYATPPAPDQPALLGLVGGVSEWLFAYPDRVSVTISAADRLLDAPREELVATIWREIAPFCGADAAMPPWQLVREKRATFAATPAMEKLRPGAATHLANLALAGDWTATGLPATIEGAIRSGNAAADLLQRSSGAGAASMAKA